MEMQNAPPIAYPGEHLFFFSIMQVEFYFQLRKHHFSRMRSCIVGISNPPFKGWIFVNFSDFWKNLPGFQSTGIRI